MTSSAKCPVCGDEFASWTWTCERCGKTNRLDIYKCGCGRHTKPLIHCPNCNEDLIFDQSVGFYIPTNQDLTNIIERLDIFEERAGVQFKGLTARLSLYDSGRYVHVYGELHSRNGEKLEKDVRVNVLLYDSSGCVLTIRDKDFSQSDFFGFEPFDFELGFKIGIPSKIRIFPQLG